MAKTRKPAPRMPVAIRGVVYPSIKAAAEAHGCTPMAIYCALSRGRIDRIGLPHTQSRHGKGITLGGVHYPSMRAASLSLGLREGYVADAMASGNPKLRADLEAFARQKAQDTARAAG